MTNWISTEAGDKLNETQVTRFYLDNETGSTEWWIIAEMATSRIVRVSSHESQEIAKEELDKLVDALVGVKHEQGVTVINPPVGAAFPGADAARRGARV